MVGVLAFLPSFSQKMVGVLAFSLASSLSQNCLSFPGFPFFRTNLPVAWLGEIVKYQEFVRHSLIRHSFSRVLRSVLLSTTVELLGLRYFYL